MAAILEALTPFFVGAILAGCVRAWQWIRLATPPMTGPVQGKPDGRGEIAVTARGFEHAP